MNIPYRYSVLKVKEVAGEESIIGVLSPFSSNEFTVHKISLGRHQGSNGKVPKLTRRRLPTVIKLHILILDS